MDIEKNLALILKTSIYREKLQELIASKSVLSTQDLEKLDKIRIFLDLTYTNVQTIHDTICEPIFKKSIQEAMGASGIVPSNYWEGLEKLRKRLRLTESKSKDIFYNVMKERLKTLFEKAIADDKKKKQPTLNRCINEFELTSPADILNKSQELLTLSWTENGKNMLTDGMDVCLCRFKDDVLTFSSAASLLYHLRDEALVEYKGKKISIGQRWKDYVFTDSHISLNDGDKLYFATDGIADQFGGNNDKKYGRPRLRAAIDEIGSHPFERQELLFRHCFNQWSGESDQVDDKTFVGLEYSSVLTKEKTIF